MSLTKRVFSDLAEGCPRTSFSDLADRHRTNEASIGRIVRMLEKKKLIDCGQIRYSDGSIRRIGSSKKTLRGKNKTRSKCGCKKRH